MNECVEAEVGAEPSSSLQPAKPRLDPRVRGLVWPVQPRCTRYRTACIRAPLGSSVECLADGTLLVLPTEEVEYADEADSN